MHVCARRKGGGGFDLQTGAAWKRPDAAKLKMALTATAEGLILKTTSSAEWFSSEGNFAERKITD